MSDSQKKIVFTCLACGSPYVSNSLCTECYIKKVKEGKQS